MRGKQAPKRDIQPDPKFNNEVIAKFVNYVMKRGKKSTAQRIVYDALEVISQSTKRDPIEVFDQALKNVIPNIEVRSRRIGGANYQIPVEVRGDRRHSLAFRWILEAARSKKGKSMKDKLASELMSAAKGEGDAIKKREDVHRMAESNRAFAHFA
ncbi:MAG: 30S ribosomal protein S7 [Patescibacteria group bacterium]|jgi:small subunit ribosomal protein S7